MTALPARGSVWVARGSCGIPARRLVRVDNEPTEHGFVEGVVWWQYLRSGAWVDQSKPRKTTSRTRLFVRRYRPLENR